MERAYELIDTLPALPQRPDIGHKGLFGRVLVVGGSDGMIGAPALAGLAALRMGAGLVQLAVPREIVGACLSIAPECTAVPLDQRTLAVNELNEAIESADAVVVGCGIGLRDLAHSILEVALMSSVPTLIDADALNMLARHQRWWEALPDESLLTPHPGEMQRLLHFSEKIPETDAERLALATTSAANWNLTLMLKGHRTVVCDAERAHINHTGDSSLSKGGSGDVLAGMLGALLAQGIPRFEAGCLGAHLHGLAGEAAGRKLTRRSVLARDVIDAIPDALRALE